MANYALRRVLQSIPILLILSVLLFIIVQAVPGGPFSAVYRDPNVTLEQVELLKHQLGLDQPLPVQYLHWMDDMLRGEMGESIKFQRPVEEMIGERVPNTLVLVGSSFVVTLVIALPVGIISARKQYSWFDHLVTTLTFIGQSVPVYWLGLALIMVFYVTIKNPFTGQAIFPAGGMRTIGGENSLADLAWHLVLPIITLSTGWVAWYSRFLRSSLLDVLHEDYVRTARAKGVDDCMVYYKHALRNALLPLVTLIALDLPSLFAGALFVEIIFAWPGMGRLFWDAARGRDYPILLAVVMINAVLIVLCNLLADLVYGLLDPRVKYD